MDQFKKGDLNKYQASEKYVNFYALSNAFATCDCFMPTLITFDLFGHIWPFFAAFWPFFTTLNLFSLPFIADFVTFTT